MDSRLRLAPGTPGQLRGRLKEVARREWYDPHSFELGQLQEFLDEQGVTDSTSPAARRPVGAAVLLGGDLRSSGEGRAPAPSPAGGVPAACAVVFASGAEPAAVAASSARIGPWQQSWRPDQHASAVSAVRAAISRGDVYQVNIVGHQSAPFDGDPSTVGAALATLAHTPYAGGMHGNGWSVFSASPECLLEVHDGVAITKPIKGTAAAHTDPAANELARAELAASSKDRAEHIMIVDLARNDLGRVSVIGSVTVPQLYAVRPLAGVWHAESTVRAVLRPNLRLASLLSAMFPGGSVTGAPKLAALRLISELEPVGRGPSMGAMGWIGSNGDVCLALTIRTVAVTANRIHLWTGGGITWGSDPPAEVAEAALKAAPLLRALTGLAGAPTVAAGDA